MTGSEVLNKVKEFAGHEKVSPYYRLWMTGSSLIIMVLAAVAVWGINSFITNEDGKIVAAVQAVSDLTSTVNNHIKADIADRESNAARVAVDETRVGRMEQNRDDVTNQLSIITGTRDKQMQSMTDAINKLSEGLSDVRSQVSEIKGRLEFAMPDHRSDAGPTFHP